MLPLFFSGGMVEDDLRDMNDVSVGNQLLEGINLNLSLSAFFM